MEYATEQSQAREEYALYIVRCEGVPRIVTWRGTVRPIYAKVKAGDGKISKRYLDNDTAVAAPITVPAKADSVLKIQIYAQHIMKDRCIAATDVLLNTLLSEEFCTVILSPIHREAPIESTVLTVHAATGLLDSSEVGRLTEAFVVHEKWSRMVNCVKPLVEIGCIVAELNPIAKMILSVIALGINQFDQRLKRLEAIHDLLDTIADASQRVYAQDEPHYRSKRQVQLKTRDILLREIHDALVYLRPLSAVSAVRRTSSQVESRIHEFKTRISTFMDDFESKGSVDTQVAVFTILEEMRLDKLPYARGVRAEPSKRCLPGTRVELLQKIRDWALSPVANRVFLLQGTAGRGKTAVAHTVALSLQEAGFVAPFFAFNWYDQERAAHQLLPTLARQLAERNKLYSQYLCDQPPSQLESRDPATQVQCLIRGGLGDCTVGAPIVFVIDALDECSDARLQAEDRRNMLQRLHDCLVDSRLPSNVRFFLTYRPDEDILDCLAQPIVQATRLSIDKVDGTERDIHAFVESKLTNTLYCDKVHAVAFAAQTLFQSAAVLCLELTRVNSPRTVVFPRELLERIMKNPGQPLYGTYRAILETHFDTTSETVIAILRQLLGWVFVMHSPQPYAVFRSIAKVHLANADDLDFVFLGLGSLLTGVTPASADPVQPLHTSFRDFILSSTHSQPFSLGHDLAAAHAEVAYACLRIMNDPIEGLRFNVCRLSRSFVLKKQIQDLEQRMSDYISPGLRYACQQGRWGAHFSLDVIRSPEPRIHRELIILLKRNFLFWLETCSYMDLEKNPSDCLHLFLKWAERSNQTDLHDFILDCIEFERHFREAISQSPPQAYISGLAFAPRESRVGRLYRNRFSVPVCIAGYVGPRDWPLDMKPMTITSLAPLKSPRRCGVSSLAYSPDGRHVALGLEKGVGVWPTRHMSSSLNMFRLEANSESDSEGEVNGEVEGIAFSPNGRLLAFSALDRRRAILIWDMHTGKQLRKVKLQKSDALVFSPDSKYIATASNLDNLKLWDLEQHRCTAKPRAHQHHDFIECMAYSPKGDHIACGTSYGAVWLWNLQTALLVKACGTVESNDPKIVSVGFSPDGRTVASLSRDSTLRLWDIESQQYLPLPSEPSGVFGVYAAPVKTIVRNPRDMFKQNEDRDDRVRMGRSGSANGRSATRVHAKLFENMENIRHMALSPDGRCVATVRAEKFPIKVELMVQNVDMRPKLGEHPRAFEEITCVAFSSNGKFIAVGLGCGTLRIWDAETFAQVGHDLVGDEGRIRSVAFSPDNARVASSSSVVRVWDVETQRRQGDTSRLWPHSYMIHCIVFSADGRYIVSSCGDRTVRTWDTVENCQVGDHLRLDECSICIALSPDGLLVACGGYGDGILRIWSVVLGQQSWSIPGDGRYNTIKSVAFSSDGTRIVYCSNSAVHLVDVEARTEVGRYGHYRPQSVAFALNDTHIVFGGHHCAGVWNPAREGEEACVTLLYGHRDAVNGVAAARHGMKIASCSSDHTVRLWDLAHLTSLPPNAAEPISEPEMATKRRQAHARQRQGWLYHDRLSRSLDPESVRQEHWLNDENNAPFLWIPPRIQRFFPPVYSPFARGVISAYPSFTVTLENDECLDEWAITYTPPSDHMMEQEMEEDEEGVIDAV